MAWYMIILSYSRGNIEMLFLPYILSLDEHSMDESPFTRPGPVHLQLHS